jgi:hypothetical protein
MHAESVHGVEVCILILLKLGFIQVEGRGMHTYSFSDDPSSFFHIAQTACNPIIFHPRLEFSYARAGKDFAK